MKESYQSGPLPENKDKSIKNTISKVGVGIAATVASLGIPEGAVAQHGLLGKIRDKINNTIELVNHNTVRGVAEEIKSEEVKKDSSTNESKTLNIPWEGDKIGFKYPFDKEYKSDDKFYRGVSLSTGFSLQAAKMGAESKADGKIINEIMQYKSGRISLNFKFGPYPIDSRYIFDEKTKLYTYVVAVEISKENVKVIDKVEFKEKLTNNTINDREEETLPETTENKKKEIKSTNQKEQTPEAPKPSPISGKPEKQPEYVKPTPENTVSFAEYKKAHEAELKAYMENSKNELDTYKKGFDNFKKEKQDEFDAYKKAQEEQFNKFKSDGENK